MSAIFSPLVLVIIIILVLSGLLVWNLRQTHNQTSQIPWIEARHDLQIWLLILAAFVTGIFIAYLFFIGPMGTG